MISIILSLAILAGMIFLLFLLVKKQIKKVSYFKERKIGANIVSAILSIFLYLILSVSLLFHITKIPQRKFDKSIWKNNVSERYKMIDDLVQSNYLIGKEKDTVESVFGKPLKIDSEKEIIEYELIGRSWGDFRIIKLRLHMEDNLVKKIEYSEHN
ncbi:hypothetical protein [Nonlabens sp.]|uniref:hypothetical protein n=1 Tax=Nonlabens sp. TaxID=1888209 RepID=UPI001BCBF14A|nr:hypothetical protein [Nonlabens sp.]